MSFFCIFAHENIKNALMKRTFLAILMLMPTVLQAQTKQVTEADINTLNSSTTIGTVSIHDPSIVYSPTNKT